MQAHHLPAAAPLDVLTLPQSLRLAVVHAVAATPTSCGAGGRPHVHRFCELIYIDAGTGQHSVGARSIPVAPGDLFLIAPGELHDSSELAAADRWVVAFGADALDPGRSDADTFLDLPADPLLLAFVRPHAAEMAYVHVPLADRPRWRSRLRQLAAELEAGALGYAEAARALLILLLTDTARLAAPQVAADTPATHPLLIRVFRYIEAHYAESISLRDVAAAVGHSPAYLTDLVRRATGRTVLAWIMERRMAEARYLLLETDHTVGQVATALGYRRASHFIAHFRRLHGATPQVWRRAQHAPRRKIVV